MMKERKVLLTLLVFVAINFSVRAQSSQGFKTILQTGHSETILGIRISPSGQYAASYASDNTVILWDLTLLKQVGIQRTEGMPKIAEFSVDEKYLYVYDGYNRLIQWDTDSGQVKEILPKGSGNVLRCYLWKDSESIVALTNDEFNVVELKTGNIIKSKKINRYKEQISSLLVSEKNGLLMAERDLHGRGHRIEIYDLATLELKQEIPFWAEALVFNEELNTIVALDHENNDLVFISLEDLSQERIKTSFARKLVMSPDQNKLAVIAYKNILSPADISLYDIESRTKIKKFPYDNEHNDRLEFIKEDRLLMMTEKRGMFIINTENDQIIKSFAAGKLPFVDMGYDVEGDRLATHHQDTIYLWDRRMQRASLKLVNARLGFAEAHYGFFPTYRSSNKEQKNKALKLFSEEQKVLIDKRLKVPEPDYYAKVNIVNGGMQILMPSHDSTSVFMGGRRYKKRGENAGLYQFMLATNEIVAYDGHPERVDLAEQSPDGKHVYSASNGEMKIWDRATQKHLATSFLFKRGGFVTITPDGYYTSSLNAVDQVVFARGKEAYTFENFDLNYNRPDIVADRLGVASPAFVSVLKNAWIKRLKRYGLIEEDTKGEIDLPVLVMNTADIPLETETKIIEIPVSVSSKVPLNRYLVSVNGVPLRHSSDFDISDINDQRTIKVELVSGENRIKVVCLNSTGFKSLSQSISINYTRPHIKPNLYLISIGVSEFKQKDYNLTYADKDAKDVITTFENGSKYDKVYSIPLLNKDANLKEFGNIKKQLLGARPEDHIIVFVASHGLLSDDLEYYLAMNDVNFESPDKGGLLYESLEEILTLSNARNRLVFLDACHSGEVDKEETIVASASDVKHNNVSARGFKSIRSTSRKVDLKSSFDLMKELFVELQQSTGATVISSASGEEYAFESPEWKNGVFTYALLRGLTSKAADKNKDGQIRVSEIQDYVYQQVKVLTNGKQNPTSRTENTENDFVVW